jgi:hypothetical protein
MQIYEKIEKEWSQQEDDLRIANECVKKKNWGARGPREIEQKSPSD